VRLERSSLEPVAFLRSWAKAVHFPSANSVQLLAGPPIGPRTFPSVDEFLPRSPCPRQSQPEKRGHLRDQQAALGLRRKAKSCQRFGSRDRIESRSFVIVTAVGVSFHKTTPTRRSRRNSRRSPTASIMTRSASQQISSQPVKQAELGRAGFVNPFGAHQRSPLTDHLEDFRRFLIAKESRKVHERRTCGRVEVILCGCGFKHIRDVSASKLFEATVRSILPRTRPVSLWKPRTTSGDARTFSRCVATLLLP
jgi:hypothetical protein